jgi:4-alpha-glucanotransferase
MTAPAPSPRLDQRTSGVLLHPTSLPGPHGSGDLGPEARRFVDFLHAAKQSFWQMLPVGPPGFGHSPYSAESAFAGSRLLVDLESLVEEGLLDRAALQNEPSGSRVDWSAAEANRARALGAAFEASQRRRPAPELEAFRERESAWLEDYALFAALKRVHGGRAFTTWPDEYRKRRRPAIERARRELRADIDLTVFEQHRFDASWRALRAYAAERGIGLIGDVPIFVAHDSADVWQHPELFRLDELGQPEVVAGVPPDYFSKTGQRWGNPLYRWKRMRATGYAFWVDRLAKMLERFDVVRLDHFIGFYRYWAIPRELPTAMVGTWVKGPRAELFDTLKRRLGGLPFIAEDLGVVTRGVLELRDRYGLPGIRVLQFAFGDDPAGPSFLPHNHTPRSVVYTGTHDNDTTAGWFHDPGDEGGSRSPAQTEKERRAALAYLGTDGREIHWDFIRLALMSVANTAIIPAQDLLGLGAEARMNLPGTATGNWAFRLGEHALAEAIAERLATLTETYGRARARGEA